MDLKHSFTVNQPRVDVWRMLTDLRAVADALPGASIEDAESDGTHRGILRVKFGALSATFRGEAGFTRVDHDSYEFTLEGHGSSSQGNATLRVNGKAMESSNGKTQIELDSAVELTGRIAQFGGSMADQVADQFLSTFAENVSRRFANELSEDGSQPHPDAPASDMRTNAGSNSNYHSDGAFDLSAGIREFFPNISRHRNIIGVAVSLSLAIIISTRVFKKRHVPFLVIALRSIEDEDSKLGLNLYTANLTHY